MPGVRADAVSLGGVSLAHLTVARCVVGVEGLGATACREGVLVLRALGKMRGRRCDIAPCWRGEFAMDSSDALTSLLNPAPTKLSHTNTPMAIVSFFINISCKTSLH